MPDAHELLTRVRDITDRLIWTGVPTRDRFIQLEAERLYRGALRIERNIEKSMRVPDAPAPSHDTERK